MAGYLLKRFILILLAVSAAGLAYDAVTMPTYSGPVTERFNGTTFYSESFARKKFTDIIKWSISRDQGPWEHRATHPAETLTERETDNLRITLVNHSTLLIQVDGINLLTDPIWSESTGPFGRVGPSRYRDPGVPFDKLPPIDVVYVSHSHYDHMDLPTLERLNQVHQPKFIVGLGNAGNLAKVDITRVVELDWWQSEALNPSLSLTMTPAQHWSKRSILDTNRTQWGSFVLQHNSKALVFFAGDTGIGEHFESIYQRFGAVNVALMPVGAYLPRWFMQDNHVSPVEALNAAETLRSDAMIPIHFGTFALGDDGQDQPLTDLLGAYRPGDKNLLGVIKSAGKSRQVGINREPLVYAPTIDHTLDYTPYTLELRVLDNGQTTTFDLQ